MRKAQGNRRTRRATKGQQRRDGTALPPMEDAHFLNIDLDVRSRHSLAPLVAAWPDAYLPLIPEGRSSPRWLILNAGWVATAEAAAKKLLQQISDLRGNARRCWMHAHRRTFDIGVQSGGPGRAFEEVRLTSQTLKRIGLVGSNIQVTMYPAQPASPVFVPPLQHRPQELRRAAARCTP